MMKKLFAGFTVAVMMVVGLVACQGKNDASDTLEKLRANSNGSQYQVFMVADNGQKHTDYFDSIPYNDDFNFSTYKITKVDGNDVYGDVIKSLGSTIEDNNAGVYLDARELNFNVKEGDKVMVIFENGYDDAILEVKKIVDSVTKVDVKEWNGFMVLDRQEKDEHHSTIVTEIVPTETYGFVSPNEVVARNVFDHADYVVLTKDEAEQVEMGGIYLITFNHDYIDSIERNDLVIANRVFGQEVLDTKTIGYEM